MIRIHNKRFLNSLKLAPGDQTILLDENFNKIQIHNLGKQNLWYKQTKGFDNGKN